MARQVPGGGVALNSSTRALTASCAMGPWQFKMHTVVPPYTQVCTGVACQISIVIQLAQLHSYPKLSEAPYIMPLAHIKKGIDCNAPDLTLTSHRIGSLAM